MDKSIVRILTFIAIMASGILPGLLIYFLCVLLVPYDVDADRGPGYDETRYGFNYDMSGDSANIRKVFGAVLIAAGVILLARMFFSWLDWRYILAGLLIICGIYLLVGVRRP